jgi:hypothetical protein
MELMILNACASILLSSTTALLRHAEDLIASNAMVLQAHGHVLVGPSSSITTPSLKLLPSGEETEEA